MSTVKHEGVAGHGHPEARLASTRCSVNTAMQ
jgi:hypothetical protein